MATATVNCRAGCGFGLLSSSLVGLLAVELTGAADGAAAARLGGTAGNPRAGAAVCSGGREPHAKLNPSATIQTRERTDWFIPVPLVSSTDESLLQLVAAVSNEGNGS